MAERVSDGELLEEAELSLEEFTALPDEEGYRLELSRGRLVREPAPGPRHGQVAYALLDLLRRFGSSRPKTPHSGVEEGGGTGLKRS